MHKFILILLLVGHTNAFAQNSICLNENNQPIDQSVYIKKCKSAVFRCFNERTDGKIIHRIEPTYLFGKIEESEFEQITALLKQRNNISFNDDATLLITYTDTLIGYDYKNAEITKYNKRIDSLNNLKKTKSPILTKKFEYSREMYGEGHSYFLKRTKKCIEKIENKLNARVFHIYQYDQDYLKDYPNSWSIKDAQVVKNTFFNNNLIGNTLLIKPDGEFLIGASNLSKRELISMIKKHDWEKHKKALSHSMKNPFSRAMGIFNLDHKKNHCF